MRPGSPSAPPPGVVVVRAPLDRGALAHAFEAVDVVAHLAGVVSAARDREYMRVNVEGTREVAAAAQAAGARLVHVSSLAAAGPAAPAAPRAEDDPPSPVTAYGWSKLESERTVAATTGLRWAILRPGVVYGPGDRAMLPLFRFAARGFLPLVGLPTAAYTFVHVEDAVSAIEAAIDRDCGGDTIFVGHANPASAREVLEAIRSALGRAVPIVPIPRPLLRLAAWSGDLGTAISGRPLAINRRRFAELYADGFVCRVDRLRDRLGVVAQIDLVEGLRQTAAWYRSAGWL